MKESNFLVLVRHGQSEWNAKNLFTGWKDPGLTEKGSEEAISAGAQIKEQQIDFSVMYTSVLKELKLQANQYWKSLVRLIFQLSKIRL